MSHPFPTLSRWMKTVTRLYGRDYAVTELAKVCYKLLEDSHEVALFDDTREQELEKDLDVSEQNSPPQ